MTPPDEAARHPTVPGPAVAPPLAAGEEHPASPSGHYGRRALRVYDAVVLGAISRWMWRCPRRTMLARYDALVGARHLDVGPGTGWFLDRCRFPVPDPEVTLLDIDDGVLATAARRIRRYRPVTRAGDVRAPWRLAPARFDSVGVNYVLHCLPGPMRDKAVVFDRAVPFLAEGGRVFGATVLGAGAHHTRRSAGLLHKLNRSGVFDNLDDRRDDLEHELAARFEEVDVRQAGAVCLFSARSPRT